ncbi:MAG TPA: helix-turn-helix domain-containing protein [Dehalococcoidia bacterium]|nr:helix-turn-helix domain-containing protein [Dehalococcoidia bacterium]
MSPVVTAEPTQMRLRERPVRRRGSRDPLPENTRYRDDGCSVSSSCFTCPLPRCRYEEPGGLRAVLNQMRDDQIMALKQAGVPIEDLALRFQVSRRTVFRVLEGTSPRSRSRRANKDNTPIPIFLQAEQGLFGQSRDRKEANCA